MKMSLYLTKYDPSDLGEFGGKFGVFEKYLEHKSRFSGKALRKVQREKRRTLNWAKDIPIEVSPVPQNLLLLAFEHYGKIPDKILLVSYLRHYFTNYENLLEEIQYCIGNRDAYEIIKTRVVKQVCDQLNIPFSIEYIYNTEMSWVINKESYEPLEMYR